MLQWLPVMLPQHVKLVVTTRSESDGVLQYLQDVLQPFPSSLLQLTSLPVQQSVTLLEQLLAADNRSAS